MASGNCELTGRFYASLDSHHIVPKEYGGEKGPTIMLGPDVHQIIHRSVSNIATREQFLSSLPSNHREKAEYLIAALNAAKSVLKKKPKNEIKITVDEKTYQRYLDSKKSSKGSDEYDFNG